MTNPKPVIVPLDAQKYVTLTARFHLTQNAVARRKEAHKTMLDAMRDAARAKDHTNLYLKVWPAYRGHASLMAPSLAENLLACFANTIAQEVQSYWMPAEQHFYTYMSKEARKERHDALVLGILRRDKAPYAEMQYEAGNVERHAEQASFPDYIKEPDWTPLLAACLAATAYDTMLQEMMILAAKAVRNTLSVGEGAAIQQTAHNIASDHCEAILHQIIAGGEYKNWADWDGSIG